MRIGILSGAKTRGALGHRTPATLAAAVLALAVATDLRAQTFPDEPIGYVGHGAAFDSKGREMALTPAFIEEAQHYYIQKLSDLAGPEQRKEFDQVRERLAAEKNWDRQTRLYGNSAMIDWLLGRTSLDPAGALASKNNFLKYAIRKRAFPNTKFVPPAELVKLGARER